MHCELIEIGGWGAFGVEKILKYNSMINMFISKMNICIYLYIDNANDDIYNYIYVIQIITYNECQMNLLICENVIELKYYLNLKKIF